MMWWGNDGWGAAGATTMVVMMLIGVVVAVGLAVGVVRRLGTSDGRSVVVGRSRAERPTAYDEAERVLARRFAVGEIDEAQFDRTPAVLHRATSADPTD